MSDNPGHWGCKTFPLIGEVCLSDAFGGGGGGGAPPGSSGGGGGGGGGVAILPGGTEFDLTDWLGITDPPEEGSSSGQTVAGCAVTLPVQVTQRAKCPPGYVVVHPPGQGKQCMLKSVAISCKLYKSPTKPPIKASDWRCLKKSAGVVRRLDTIAKMANRVTGKANLSRSRGKR
jgi:hypothetical protein